MHDIFSREPDPLEGMLRPPSTPPVNEELRQAVYTRTQGMLRRRRHLKQLAYTAALLVSFAAGLLVMRVTMQPAPMPVVVQPRQQELRPPDNPPSPSPENPKPPALAKEWSAFDSNDQRGELYRQAGDSYMEDEYDPQSALRCYTNALEHGTKQDLTISADDNWLLMAIKEARQKEKTHAKTGS
jgi:hypothetical protein